MRRAGPARARRMSRRVGSRCLEDSSLVRPSVPRNERGQEPVEVAVGRAFLQPDSWAKLQIRSSQPRVEWRMDTVQRQPRGTEFGEFLRGARERRGLTILQVSNETKIPWRHLDAFERGDLTVVPNGMYRRAEVRAYARAVGLDQNAALTELERALIAAGLTAAPPEPHARVARP